ncbi:hypothetical protein [Nocardioides dongkuii]|uniref:hypothetical protein n=1 Tax=Nocardioides dongkuii TaxID=2760089 RepID=UPI0015F9447D|nr:hypothetical protein [Nocardioides dongkuii]
MSRRATLRLLGMGAAASVGAGTFEPAAAAPRRGPTSVTGSGGVLVGMGAPVRYWDQRVREVGPGISARRIYADLADGAGSQIRIVEQAHDDGMLPVISYKVGGDVTGAVNGRYNGVAEDAAARLASYGKPTAVTFWHEPYNDLTAANYVAASKQLLPIFRRGKLQVGPILNGWLLDNRQSDFAAFCPNQLFRFWDWFGIDSYESGTKQNPGKRKPADRIPALRSYLRSRGHGSLPIGIGEYNGYSGRTISDAGDALFTTPNVWFGCVWNSGDWVLSGNRLAAFRRTLARSA